MAKKRGKQYKQALAQLGEAKREYSLQESVEALKKVSYARFDESVTLDVSLGIDPTKGDQVVRGNVVLPKGTGKTPRVAVFAKGEHAEKAQAAGADHVGAEDLVERISGGWFDFDYSVATPDMMGVVGKVARTLGPKGLLPNKKLGTVTFDVGQVVQDLKAGMVFFRNDRYGLVHGLCGKLSFSVEDICENVRAYINALSAAKPSTSKGIFVQQVVITSTMGPGLRVDISDLYAKG